MRIVVTGASGQVGSYVIDRLTDGPHEIVAWSGATRVTRGKIPFQPVELTDSLAVARALDLADPDVVIHLAAISSAEAAQRDPCTSEAVNIGATRWLSEWATHHDRRIVFTSTDLVFDGSQSWYNEESPACPTGIYGQTKHAAERFVLGAARGLVARLSLLYGRSLSAKDGFFDRTTSALRAGVSQSFFSDEYRTPLDYATAARVLVRLAESDIVGLLHVGGPERLSRFELMAQAARALGIDSHLVQPNRREDVPLATPRPADVSLDSSRLRRLCPDLQFPGVADALAPLRHTRA